MYLVFINTPKFIFSIYLVLYLLLIGMIFRQLINKVYSKIPTPGPMNFSSFLEILLVEKQFNLQSELKFSESLPNNHFSHQIICHNI